MAPVPSLVEVTGWFDEKFTDECGMTLNDKVITLGHRRYVDANDIEISSGVHVILGVSYRNVCWISPSVVTKQGYGKFSVEEGCC